MTKVLTYEEWHEKFQANITKLYMKYVENTLNPDVYLECEFCHELKKFPEVEWSHGHTACIEVRTCMQIMAKKSIR